jgi:hypothetical protein
MVWIVALLTISFHPREIYRVRKQVTLMTWPAVEGRGARSAQECLILTVTCQGSTAEKENITEQCLLTHKEKLHREGSTCAPSVGQLSASLTNTSLKR